MESADLLRTKLASLARPAYRGQLLARGLARGMIWLDGKLPPDSPDFSPHLTVDLLDHGYRMLDAAISLLEVSGQSTDDTDRALRIAGEAIESAVRRGDVTESSRGFHLVCAAAAFHIAHYSARSYCLLRGELELLNLSSPERLLAILMSRDLALLQQTCIAWVRDIEHTDDRIAERLGAENNDFGPEDVLFLALAGNFCRALAIFEFGLIQGEPTFIQQSVNRLTAGVDAAARSGHIPMWWITRLARFLVDDLWRQSYHVRLPETPPGEGGNWNELRRQFIHLMASKDLAHIEFWPSQLAAAGRVVDCNDSLVVALPTSSGKTRIAEICILRCLADGKRAIYVTPLRALSAQVESLLAATFRPLGFSTTVVYGASGVAAADVETLRSGDIVVATPEKLDFAIRQDPDVIADVGVIVLDEGHMIGLGEREIRYEALVQRLLQRNDAANRRIVCLSAIFSAGPSFDAFTEWIRAERPGDAIRSTWRPTRQRRGELIWHGSAARLDYSVEGTSVFVPRFVEAAAAKGRRQNPFPQNRNELIVATVAKFSAAGKATLIYCPIRRSVETLAESFLKAARQGYFTVAMSGDHLQRIADAERVGKEWLGDSHPAVKALRIGVAVHHGQLPRAFLREIEELLRDRVLKVVVSSPTLAQGVDLSFEVLIFSSLWRNRRLIPAMEFANVIGRVGRAHVDIDGIYVLPLFPEANSNIATRIDEFRTLDAQAKQRQMESGILLLLRVMVTMLAEKLGLTPAQVAEYVLNNQDAWDKASAGDDDRSKWIVAAANELDNAIFSTITNLDCPANEVAAQLDDALKNSYWQKRVQTLEAQEQHSQSALLKGRASWLWNATTPQNRRGFFSAGIGFSAGTLIIEQAVFLGALLAVGEIAVQQGNSADSAAAAIGVAEHLLGVYPFACDLPERWKLIITNWLAGEPTSTFATDEIAFIQDGLVYRLVWAVEAIRTTLSADGTLPLEAEGGHFALCITYGVPSIPAALVQQAGLSSRRLAVKLVNQLDLTFFDNEGLKIWLGQIAEDTVKPLLDPLLDQPEWDRFVVQIKRSANPKWLERQGTLQAVWTGPPPKSGDKVRVQNALEGEGIDVLTPTLDLLGKVPRHTLWSHGTYFCQVSEDGRHVDLRHFGPADAP